MKFFRTLEASSLSFEKIGVVMRQRDREKISCVFSGPIEQYPDDAFQKHSMFRDAFHELDIAIIGDTFELLKSRGTAQAEYGAMLKLFRNHGWFYGYGIKEMLLVPSLRNVRVATFMVVKPSRKASGGTVSEVVQAHLRGVPMLVIIGAHGENLFANDSTFMIRMLTGRFALVFDTEKDVIDFVRKHIAIFRQGRSAVRKLISDIKRKNPYINDRPRPLLDPCFYGTTLILLGMPCAGKSKQARMLQDQAGFAYFGSGHELRRLGTKNQLLQKLLEKGGLAPQMMVAYLLAEALLPLERFEAIVLDGSPKMRGEAELLFPFLQYVGRTPKVIVLDIPEDAARRRMALRRNCAICDTTFASEAVAQTNICPQCGGAVSARPENEDAHAIERMFAWYRTEVEAVIKFFETKGFVTHIDGERNKEEVFADILSALGK